MSDSMIERVARALDAATELALETHGRFDTRQMARAAIEAMREPTPKMLGDAGTMAGYDLSHFPDEADAFHIEWWQAMIDCALQDVPE